MICDMFIVYGKQSVNIRNQTNWWRLTAVYFVDNTM